MKSSTIKYLNQIGPISVVLLIGYITNILNYGYLFGFALIIMIVLKSNYIRSNLNIDVFILFLFSLCYGLFYSFNPVSGNQYIIIYIFTPPAFLLWGKFLAYKTVNTNQLFYTLICIGILFSLPALITVILNVFKGGFVQSERNIPMFWGGPKINATGMAAKLLFNMCIPSILLTKLPRYNLIVKTILGIIFALSLISVLRLGSRTQLVIVFLTFLLTVIYLFPRQSIKRNLILFSTLLLGVVLISQKISFDLDADWLSSFADRMDKRGSDIASGGGRTERWSKSLKYLFEKPLGWDVKEFGYAHNLWLDALRVSGIIPFIILIIFSIRSILKVRNIVSQADGLLSLNILLITFTTAFFLVFMVEPILDGSFYVFALFCLFYGTIIEYQEARFNLVEN